MNRFLSVVFWSVLAAAFIGPGTVTTAALAGSGFGFALLWALVFSTLACWALQEAAARLTVVSGRNLGQALAEQYPRGWGRLAVLTLVSGAILLGCAAYEAGNILGGVTGAHLALGWPRSVLTIISATAAALLLWFNSPRRVALALSIAVAVMGVAFLMTALSLRPQLTGVLVGALRPSLPAGSAVLALGLVGTTVVPYNLFLGSGIAAGQSVRELRFGIGMAVLLGGLISMAVLIAGTAVTGEFSLAAVAEVLVRRLGGWGRWLFAAGLFAAGLSSAVTAPLAAAVTARSLFGGGDRSGLWGDGSWRYRATWLGVLLTGVGFGLSGVRPEPAIVLAQAFNGILLPIAAVFLLLAVNDRRVVGPEELNGALSNAVLVAVSSVALLLGLSGVARAAAAATGGAPPATGKLVMVALLGAAVLAAPLWRAIKHRRSGSLPRR